MNDTEYLGAVSAESPHYALNPGLTAQISATQPKHQNDPLTSLVVVLKFPSKLSTDSIAPITNQEPIANASDQPPPWVREAYSSQP